MLLIASRIARSEISRKKERKKRKNEEEEEEEKVASETTTRKIRHVCERGVS